MKMSKRVFHSLGGGGHAEASTHFSFPFLQLRFFHFGGVGTDGAAIRFGGGTVLSES